MSLVGVSKFTRKLNYAKRLLFNFGYFTIFLIVLFIIDYISVVNINQAPRFSTYKITSDTTIYYDTPFYDVIRCNRNTEDEYFKVMKNQSYDENNIQKYCK